MKFAIRIMFFVVSASLPFHSYAEGISKASVESMLEQLDKSISARDTATVDEIIADHAFISGTVTVQGATQEFRMDKAQYMQALEATWAQAESYTYNRESVKIRLFEGKAELTGKVVEMVRIGGRTIVSHADETAVVERIDGRLRITRVTGQAQVR